MSLLPRGRGMQRVTRMTKGIRKARARLMEINWEIWRRRGMWWINPMVCLFRMGSTPMSKTSGMLIINQLIINQCWGLTWAPPGSHSLPCSAVAGRIWRGKVRTRGSRWKHFHGERTTVHGSKARHYPALPRGRGSAIPVPGKLGSTGSHWSIFMARTGRGSFSPLLHHLQAVLLALGVRHCCGAGLERSWVYFLFISVNTSISL